MNYIFYSKQEEIIPVVAMAYHALQKDGGLCKLISNRMGELIDETLIPERENVYLVGYCFTDATIASLETMIRKENKVVWLDNHGISITSHKKFMERQMHVDKLEAVLEKKKSLARIVWEYFNPTVIMPEPVFYLDRWEEYDMTTKEIKYFHTALSVREEYSQVTSGFWEELFYNPESTATKELVTIGKYISIDRKKNALRNLNRVFVYKMEDDSEFAFLNGMADKYMFDAAYRLFDGCVSYYYDGGEWKYHVFSKEKNVAGEYAMKHGGSKKYRSGIGNFKKNMEDNLIYWDFLESRKVSPLYEHPKYKAYMESLSEM